jgi:arylamine N-acetyltransferase
MTNMPPLSPDLTRAVLDHLGVQSGPPALALVDKLLAAYIRVVPWETAFRIAKRARTANTADCPRWPDEFWRDAIQFGGGGTCFETNYAFFSLLRALSYEGYLTINNRGDHIAVHTAVVLDIDGKSWLVDAGMPLFAILALDPLQTTERQTPFLNYTVRPDGLNRYQVEREPHPRPNCYTLINVPVDDADYRAATTADYGEKAQFLEHVIVNKIVDEHLWRFTSAEPPFCLQVFEGSERIDHPITSDPAEALASHFGVDAAILHAAFEAVGDK